MKGIQLYQYYGTFSHYLFTIQRDWTLLIESPDLLDIKELDEYHALFPPKSSRSVPYTCGAMSCPK